MFRAVKILVFQILVSADCENVKMFAEAETLKSWCNVSYSVSYFQTVKVLIIVKLKTSAFVQPSSDQNMYWRSQYQCDVNVKSISMPMSSPTSTKFKSDATGETEVNQTFQVNQSIWNPLKCCNVGTLLEGSVKLTFTWICCGNFCTPSHLFEARNRRFWQEKGNKIDVWILLEEISD